MTFTFEVLFAFHLLEVIASVAGRTPSAEVFSAAVAGLVIEMSGREDVLTGFGNNGLCNGAVEPFQELDPRFIGLVAGTATGFAAPVSLLLNRESNGLPVRWVETAIHWPH